MSGGPKARHLRPVPCGGSRTACRRPGRVASSRAPSPGGSMLPGVLYADGLRGRSGFPTPAKGSLVRFRRAPRYLSVRRPPPARTGGFILPRACRLLQSSTACDLPRDPTTSQRAELRSASLGVPLPHRGTSKRRPPMRGIPDPALRSVLGVSHALDGLLRHLPCGFVSPRSHVQGLPSRGLSLARSRTGFPGPFMPSWRWTRKACGVTRASLRALDFRAFSPRGECGGERNLFRVPSAPRPSWALPPPGFPSTHRGNDFAFPPPTAFVRSEPAPTGPRRLDGAGRG